LLYCKAVFFKKSDSGKRYKWERRGADEFHKMRILGTVHRWLGPGDPNRLIRSVTSNETWNPRVKAAQFAVRDAPVVIRARELEKMLGDTNVRGKAGAGKPSFDTITLGNVIFDPHSLKQQHIAIFRQVMCLATFPELITQMQRLAHTGCSDGLFPDDTIQRARLFSREKSSEHLLHQAVARFIATRDNIEKKWQQDICQNIILVNDKSQGVSLAIQILTRTERDGVLVAVPDLTFSGAVALHGGHAVRYNLKMQREGWSFCVDELEKAVGHAQGITVRALAVSNPSLFVADGEQLQKLVSFCERHGLILLADEEYQDHIYSSQSSFSSFRKVVTEMGSMVQVISCQAGYLDLVNIPPPITMQVAQQKKTHTFKVHFPVPHTDWLACKSAAEKDRRNVAADHFVAGKGGSKCTPARIRRYVLPPLRKPDANFIRVAQARCQDAARGS
jgi:hypothetical protein